MATGKLGISIGAALVGTLDSLGGLQAMLIGMAAAHLCSVTLFVLARVGR